MKKLLILLAAVLFVGTVSAQETPATDDAALRTAIVGKYQVKKSEGNPGGGRVMSEMTETYGEDGSYESVGTMTFRMSAPEVGSVRVDCNIKMAGTYTIEGGVISYKYDPDLCEFKAHPGSGEYDEMIADAMTEQFEQSWAELGKPENQEMLQETIISIDSKQMVTKEHDGKKVTHKRK